MKLLWNIIKSAISLVVFSTMLAVSTALLPLCYRKILRDYVGSKVFFITKDKASVYPNQSSGTGFLITAPSGAVFLMTNRHVCDDEVQYGMLRSNQMWAKDSNTNAEYLLKIVYKSANSDLCIASFVDPITLPALKVGKPPSIGEAVSYVGHPNGQPLTMTTGEFAGYQPHDVAIGLIGGNVLDIDCTRKDTRKVAYTKRELLDTDISYKRFSLMQGKRDNDTVYLCHEYDQAMVMTVIIYAGASGSPVVDLLGRVIGVVYSAPRGGGWGAAVPLSAVNDLLRGR